jgi:hypothetical protein
MVFSMLLIHVMNAKVGDLWLGSNEDLMGALEMVSKVSLK